MNHRLLVTDPFRTNSSATRRQIQFGFVTLLIVLGGVSFVEYQRRGPAGALVEAHIVAFGSATWTGNQVPLTVQLQDGTTRQVVAPRAAIVGCKVGSRISLQLGGYIRVAPQGCRINQHPLSTHSGH